MSATSTPGKRESKSLTNITKQFIEILKEHPERRMSVVDVEQKLESLGIHFSRRRLSDVVNVLEGIGVIQRLQILPRMYHVQLVANTSDPDFVAKKNRLNDEVRALSQKERELHELLTQSLSTFKALKDHPSARSIGADDLLKVPALRDGLSFFIPSVEGMHISVNMDMESFLTTHTLNCVRAKYSDPFTVQGLVSPDQVPGSPPKAMKDVLLREEEQLEQDEGAAIRPRQLAVDADEGSASSTARNGARLPPLALDIAQDADEDDEGDEEGQRGAHTREVAESLQQVQESSSFRHTKIHGGGKRTAAEAETGAAASASASHGSAIADRVRAAGIQLVGSEGAVDVNGQAGAKRAKTAGEGTGPAATSSDTGGELTGEVEEEGIGLLGRQEKKPGPLFELKCDDEDQPYTMVMDTRTSLSDLLGL